MCFVCDKHKGEVLKKIHGLKRRAHLSNLNRTVSRNCRHRAASKQSLELASTTTMYYYTRLAEQPA